MTDDRFLALIGMLCLLLWLLSRETRIAPGLRRLLALVAYGGIATALAYAVVLSFGYFMSG